MSSWLDSPATPPAWLRWFANDAARSFLDTAVHAPIGCHYHYVEDRNEWEITVFVSDTEVVGGAQDGTRVPCCVQLDLSQAAQLFDELPQIYWQSGPVDESDDISQYVSMEGRVRGHRTWLRFLSESPANAGPGRLLHAMTGKLEDLW